MKRPAACFLVSVLLVPSLLYAGSFTVSPVKLFLNAKRSAEVIRVTNKGDEAVTVQVRTMKWTQNATGEERIEPTGELVTFPKMITLARSEEKSIRVGFKGQPPAVAEGTYRIYLDELPVAEPGESMVKVALSIGCPVFVSPAKEAKPVPSFESAELADGKVAVKVRNTGNAHFIVQKMRLQGKDSRGTESFATEQGGWYVLAGAAQLFHLDIPRQECLKSKSVRVTVSVEKTDMEKTFEVEKSRCPPPEPPGDNTAGPREKTSDAR